VAEPFMFIGTHAIKDGMFDEYEEYFRKFASEVVEANEPRLIAFNGYASEDGREVTVVQVHPDAASMRFHMQLIREHVADAYERFLDGTTRIEVYGEPDDATLEMIGQLATSGAPISVKPRVLGGFTRSAAEAAVAAAG